MKYDMSGGATVIGAMRAIALLKRPFRSSVSWPGREYARRKASRPSDVVTA